MRTLVVNAGSSSLKLELIDGGNCLASRVVQRWDGSDPDGPLREFLDRHGPVDAAGHRVVHGGARFVEPTLITEAAVAALEDLVPLAPLHQPRALAAMRAARRALPEVAHVACFDTAFHSSMLPAVTTYAVPADWTTRWGLRKYGFHGLSHAWASRRASEMLDRVPGESGRILSCHLGSGASLCAIRDGRSVDTTMGFTPLDGLVMGTRAGAVDPGMLLWLIESGGVAPAEMSDALEHQSGLAGMSGVSGDYRDVERAAQAGDREAWAALRVFSHRLTSCAGAMIASMGGLDALVFTGGIGEHAAAVRERLAADLAFLGVRVDVDQNAACHSDAIISDPGSQVRVLVVTSREDLQIADSVGQLLA